MKKIITSILFLCVCTFLSAQSILNVSGVVSTTDGSAATGVFVSIILENGEPDNFVLTNEDGFYEFVIELGNDNTQGCFELFMIDCNFEGVFVSGCYDPGNLEFNFDFVYCENGTDTCNSYIITELTGTSLNLSVFSFGVAPYTYEWSDGSNEPTLVLPADEEGEYCVEVTDAQGCIAEACIDLTPPDPCFVHIFEEYNFNSVLLFAEGYGQTDELSYTWSTGETGEIISVTESGEYCVTLSDELGCESFDCRYIEVDSSWNQDCFAYIYSSFEDDGTETLFAESFGVGPFTYEWTLGDSIISTSNFVVPDIIGVYCVAVTDAEGCEFTTCYDYFIWEDCGVWIGCDPIDTGVQLWAFGYGAEPIEYIWSNGDVGQELIVTENGEYCVTITDATGCTSSACIDVNTDVSECFVPIDVIEFDTYAELTLNLNSDGPYEITWSNGESTPSIIVDESDVYCVDVLELETGCSFTTCAVVYIGGQDDCWGYIETEILGDTSALLTVIAFESSNDSLNFEYQWSNGENAESIEVTEEGTYCVTVSGSDNCVFEVCTDVIFLDFPFFNSIVGIVFDSETGNVLEAEVDIYAVLDDGTVELYAEGNETMEIGLFFVEEVDQGNYIALATVEGGAYVPTYAQSTSSWEEATVYTIDDSNGIAQMEISMIPVTNIDGIGTIEGSVSTENLKANGKEIGTRSSGPLAGANVMLMHTQIPVGQLFTDDEGHYKFTNLPFGTYNVVLEIPGLPRKIIEVTLSEDNPNASGVEFETDATTTATDNIAALSSLTLSPNPASNTLVVNTYFTENKSVLYNVIDMNGKIVESSSFQAKIGENRLELDVVPMQNGIYNLVLQTKEELITKRFIKM